MVERVWMDQTGGIDGRDGSGRNGTDETVRLQRAGMEMHMKVLFVAGFGPIIRDVAGTTALYLDTLGLPLENDDGYFHTEQLAGAKSFALWPLSQAAQSCFGSETWPESLPKPQAWLEFDVDDVAAATEELRARGYTVLVAARKEPWGQIVTRLLGPEGLLIGITYTPSMRDDQAEQA
jgi:catechol 2,3-dioxygenase-like lactoylglutathione lyase family enzyme